jgi:single-stranded-DNA-specific exonuclease
MCLISPDLTVGGCKCLQECFSKDSRAMNLDNYYPQATVISSRRRRGDCMSEFCGEKSVLNREWEVRRPANSAHDNVITESAIQVPAVLSEILRGRGFPDAGSFLEPTLKSHMPDPYILQGMKEAVLRFGEALTGKEKIALYGDYDVDGATSTALVQRYLRLAGIQDSVIYIPQRLTEGYGPNAPAMDILRDGGASLVVILDSGTLAFGPIERARELGMSVIVIDHHEPLENGDLPDAIVVNPKRQGEDGSLAHLCTAGLAFLFLAGVGRHLRSLNFFAPPGPPEPKLTELMGLVALGTVADMVSLHGLNRVFVRQGLPRLELIPGIRALLEVTSANSRAEALANGRKWKERPVDARTCGFSLGPCINAGGRISDTMLGAKLLTNEDPAEVAALAETLDCLNRERRKLQEGTVENCIASVSARNTDDKVIVAYDESWHPGVVGLAANRIKDEFDRSAVVIGTGGKGSGRGLRGFNIGLAFQRAHDAGLLIKGGGHAAAGGLTIDPLKMEEFRAFMNLQAQNFTPMPTEVDLAVPVGGLKVSAVEAFSMLEPFGQGNEPPVVVFTGGVLRRVQILSDVYVKATLHGGDYSVKVFFRGAGTKLGKAILAAEGRYVDLMGKVTVDTYGNAPSVQIEPRDAMIGPPAIAYSKAA